jgi:hypothetical protein
VVLKGGEEHLFHLQNHFTSPQTDFASSQNDSALSQTDFTSSYNDFTLSQNDFASSHNDYASSQNDFTLSKNDFASANTSYKLLIVNCMNKNALKYIKIINLSNPQRAFELLENEFIDIMYADYCVENGLVMLLDENIDADNEDDLLFLKQLLDGILPKFEETMYDVIPYTPDNLSFDIRPAGPISEKFLAHNISTFEDAAFFIRMMPYGRNQNKTDLTTVFADGCGTCSTKHALLKQLADENGVGDVKLIIGLFRMNAVNTPKIAATLNKYQLEYIPEAHNYLKWENQVLDYTHKSSSYADFEKDLIEEIEILPHQITDYKVAYHKQYLKAWLEAEQERNLTLDELWTIREQCIADLSVLK